MNKNKSKSTSRPASKGSLLGPAARGTLTSVPIVNVEDAEGATPPFGDDASHHSGGHSLVGPGGGSVVNAQELDKLAPRFSTGMSLETTGAKLKMPSAQAAKLTKAYNQLLSMKAAGSVEAVVRRQVEEVRSEIEQLKKQCNLVHTVSKEQEEFKTVWMSKYLQSKELFLAQWDAMDSPERPDVEEAAIDQRSRYSSVPSRRTGKSIASSVRSALIRAEEEQAVLLLKLQQLEEQQAQRRDLQNRRRRERLRQEEEEERLEEQRERQELEQRIEGVRVRRAALSNAASEGEADSQQGLDELPAEHQPVEAWLRDNPAPPRGNEGGFVSISAPPPGCRLSTQDQLLQHVILSQAKLPVFKGEPLDFLWFQKAFEAQVSSVTTDPARRLYLLLQQLQGQPYDMVKGCQLLNPEVGYQRAMHKLQERYGNPVRQAMAFRTKLMTWPSIKNNTELESFNVQLQLCQDVKLSVNGLAELDSPATLLQLAAKLPTKLQLSWQTKAFDIEEKEQREANFSDFTKFIARQSGLRCHPVYGKLSQERDKDGKKSVRVTVTDVVKNEAEVNVTATQERTSRASHTTKSSAGGKGSLTASNRDMKRTWTMGDEVPPNAFREPCLLCSAKHPTNVCRNTDLSKKERYEKLKGLCFACLKPGHLARSCEERLTCKKCNGSHPTVLHVDREQGRREPTKGEHKEGKEEELASESTLATQGAHSYAIATLPVKVWYGTSEPIVVQAVLDPASTATFIDEHVARQLNLTPQSTAIGVTTIRQQSRMPVGCIQGLKLGDVDGNHEFSVQTAYVIQSLPFSRVPQPEDTDKWPHLQKIPFTWAPEVPVAMLIGLNVAAALRPEQLVHGQMEEPYAVRTPLGWAIHGALGQAGKTQSDGVFWTRTQAAPTGFQKHVAGNDVTEQLNRLYYADFRDAYDFTKRGESWEDKEWRRIVAASAKRESIKPQKGGEEGHQYTIALPFKKHAQDRLENNHDQALKRLTYVKRKLANDQVLRNDYTTFMNKMIDQGYVEEVTQGESPPTGPVSYVLHHGVYHPKKHKLRVVFNCASRYRGVALNDCLLQGPDLTNSLVGVLLRFRQFKVAFMADIESMFYRVRVPVQQRDVLRLLWWKGEGEAPTTYRMTVHLFGATSSPSIANFALRKAASDALKAGEITAEVKRAVERNFYVDDCLKSVKTDEEAISVAHGIVKACAYGGFRLTKFVSTSAELLQSLPKSELARDIEVSLNDDKTDPLGSMQERALGVTWALKTDCFKFAIPKCESNETMIVTKRRVLSKLSAVYDPLGIAAPVTIVARMLFRDLTKSQLEWDEQVGEDMSSRWVKWEKNLIKLREVSLPRCLTEASRRMQLHVFCDASAEAYSAVAFLRESEQRPSDNKVTFIMGKARVSPPKVTTIPRLELTAAKLATEMACTIGQEWELMVESRVFWSDSTTVLKYLKNQSRRFHVFVSNRICAILNNSRVEEWRYVPTASNPADAATRGLGAEKLSGSSWLRGPSFLRDSEEMWPVDPEVHLQDGDPELKREEEVNCTQEEHIASVVEALASHYSSAYKVRRAFARLLQVKDWLKRRVKGESLLKTLSLQELQQGEMQIIVCLQRATWPAERRILQEGKTVPRKSALFKLSPVLKGELVVMSGRARAHLPIVPKSRYGELLAQEAHAEQCHQGRAITAAAVLRRYWVVGLNKIVRHVVRNCPGCQRRRARPHDTMMAPLPTYRFQPLSNRPFHVTGVDYFGPFHAQRARSRIKVYGVIFTCAASRAVHLEIAENLSSESFINALRRFVARRGHVTKFVSDNGTNFKGAQTQLHAELRKELLKQKNSSRPGQYLKTKQIEWMFNPPGASHHGGFWERLIGSVRRILEVLMERQVLTQESLATMMCEAEAVLNNRPLTPISDDPDDLDPLTPNHLLLGHCEASNTCPPGDYDDTAGALRFQWKRVQHVTNEFWRRWHKEYRVLLQHRSKWHQPVRRQLQVNDPVLVLDPLLPRDQWKLGRVVAVHRNAQDKDVRVVDVKTKQGLLTRPITKICLLEAASEN